MIWKKEQSTPNKEKENDQGKRKINQNGKQKKLENRKSSIKTDPKNQKFLKVTVEILKIIIQ